MQHTKKLFFLLVITVIFASTLWGVTLEKITERNSNIDLSEFHMDEESKKNGSSYNQKTHVLISKGGAGIGRFRGELTDASDYNSLKIKYKVKKVKKSKKIIQLLNREYLNMSRKYTWKYS